MKDERCEVLQDFTSEEQTFRQELRALFDLESDDLPPYLPEEWAAHRARMRHPAVRERVERKVMHRLGLCGDVRSRRGLLPQWRPTLTAILVVCLLAGIFLALPPTQGWARGVIRAVMGKLTVISEQTWAERVWPEFESGEYEESCERLPQDWPTRWTLDELQAKIDFPLLLPSYLPQGYHQDSLIPFPLLSSSPDDKRAQRQLSYQGIQVVYSDGSPDGTICLNERKIVSTKRFPVGQADVREVVVRGEPAVWVKGALLSLGKAAFPIGQITRDLEAMNVLLWEKGDISFELSTTDLGLPLEEMLKIAESMSESD